jgi:hypothetical protein
MIDRLSSADLTHLEKVLASYGLRLSTDPAAEEKLRQLRSLYEPYLEGIGRNLLIELPPWWRETKKKDNWQAGPWDLAVQARSLETLRIPARREHF